MHNELDFEYSKENINDNNQPLTLLINEDEDLTDESDGLNDTFNKSQIPSTKKKIKKKKRVRFLKEKEVLCDNSLFHSHKESPIRVKEEDFQIQQE